MNEKAILKKLAKIATENIPALARRRDLESHGNDAEDFFEASVWRLEAALVEAYELGRKEGKA